MDTEYGYNENKGVSPMRTIRGGHFAFESTQHKHTNYLRRVFFFSGRTREAAGCPNVAPALAAFPLKQEDASNEFGPVRLAAFWKWKSEQRDRFDGGDPVRVRFASASL
jgi:hypothetical protein